MSGYFNPAKNAKRLAHKQRANHTFFKYSRIMSAAVAPSPTALATCLVLPLRTSPAANTPGTLVISRSSVVMKP